MPVIDHRSPKAAEPMDDKTARIPVVTKEDGAASLTIRELVMQDGSALRLHTHPTDEAIILLKGRVEMIVGDESHTGSPGDTLLAPPEILHRLVNSSGSEARMYTIFPTDNPTTTYVD